MMKVEMPAATGIMTCYNRIGAAWGGAGTAVLAEGIVITLVALDKIKGKAAAPKINSGDEF